MAIHSVFVLNKAGGLIFQRDYGKGARKLADTNDYLVLAGTLHSVHALTARIAPGGVPSSGLQLLEMPSANVHCFQTLTGVKFIVVTDKSQTGIPAIASHLHMLYADYTMKNPFHTLEMPIRSIKFDRNLEKYVQSVA